MIDLSMMKLLIHILLFIWQCVVGNSKLLQLESELSLDLLILLLFSHQIVIGVDHVGVLLLFVVQQYLVLLILLDQLNALMLVRLQLQLLHLYSLPNLPHIIIALSTPEQLANAVQLHLLSSQIHQHYISYHLIYIIYIMYIMYIISYISCHAISYISYISNIYIYILY